MKDKIIYPEGHENRPEFKILKVSLKLFKKVSKLVHIIVYRCGMFIKSIIAPVGIGGNLLVVSGTFSAPRSVVNNISNTPKGIRIPVCSVKGSCPRPLDDGGYKSNLSGQRDSNARHQPWQGCALPLSYARD